jgi:hypothetical protein
MVITHVYEVLEEQRPHQHGIDRNEHIRHLTRLPACAGQEAWPVVYACEALREEHRVDHVDCGIHEVE